MRRNAGALFYLNIHVASFKMTFRFRQCANTLQTSLLTEQFGLLVCLAHKTREGRRERRRGEGEEERRGREEQTDGEELNIFLCPRGGRIR